MVTNSVKELAIVKKVMSLLKLDDAGKIDKFYRQEIKSSKEAIEGLNLNLQVYELERKREVSRSNKNIEDAEIEIEEAYNNVKPENVTNNAAATAYSSVYWAGVEAAERKLNKLKESAKQAEKIYNEIVEDVKGQIAKYQYRIDKIGKEV